MTPRFLIAKYVSDLNRMEPRNIGVLLWTKGEVCARFLDANDADFINDQETYQRWIKHWESAISGDKIAPKHGASVAKSDPKCMDALQSSQGGQYLLVDAGELLQPIKKVDLSDATGFLFSELVARTQTSPVERVEMAVGLSQRCESAFDQSGVAARDDFHRKYHVELPVYGVKRRFRFSYGVGNGQPIAVFQRVVLSKEQSVNSAALMLHEITDDAVVSRSHCAALVQKRDVTNELAEEGYEWLQGICEVVDVDDENSADHISSLVPS